MARHAHIKMSGAPPACAEIDGEDLVSELEAAAAVDCAVDGDAGDEDAVVAVDPVALPDVQSEGLSRTLHNLHKTC